VSDGGAISMASCRRLSGGADERTSGGADERLGGWGAADPQARRPPQLRFRSAEISILPGGPMFEPPRDGAQWIVILAVPM
jgi:hypothetical protein